MRLSLTLVLSCFFCVALAAASSAQGPDTLWAKTYGGSSSDYGYSIQQTLPDGGYIITGSTFSYGEGSYDLYYIKTDADGEVDWAKTYGGTGTDHGSSVQQTLDGGYILAGYTNSSGAGGYDILLAKTDSGGTVDWAYTYGGWADDRAWHVQQTMPDSGYIVAGYTETFGAGGGDAYVLRTDARGGFLWGRPYGGPDWDEARHISQTFPDSGYILVGTTSSYGAGADDVYLIKIDADGDTLWTRTCGGTGSEYGYSVQRTFPDSGYVIVGNTYSFGAGDSDLYLVKTDQDGDTLWTRTFGGSSVEYGYSVQQTSPQPGYIIAGSTRSFGEGNFDAYVIKTDTQGDPVWTRTYGGALYDDGYCVRQTAPDSGYVVAGSTRSFGAGVYDIYVVKTEPVLAGIDGDPAGRTEFMLSAGEPNPFRDRTVIRFRLGRRSRVTIAMHNVLGQRVATLLDATRGPGTHIAAWDGRDSVGHALAPGIYFCTLQVKDQIATRKIVLVR
ncbi:MAG: T9SS type A sorting domain-containing protein [Candidatus Eisenbacteria bacterium]